MATERIYYKAGRDTTGLTDVLINIYGPAGTLVVTNGSMTELGSGIYYYDYTTTTNGKYIAKMDSATRPNSVTYEFEIDVENTTSTSVTTILYCTSDDVYRTAGIDSSIVSAANVTEFIKEAEGEVDRIVNNTFWKKCDNGTATSASTSVMEDSSKTWTADEYIDNWVWIYDGTGENQIRKISDNNATSITVETAFDTAPDTTSKYRLIHTGTNPYEEMLDEGDDTGTFFLPKYPLINLDFAASKGVTITTSNIYQYKDFGKLVINTGSAEASYWSSDPQAVSLKYYYGVYPMPYDIQTLTRSIAALKALIHQIGGTFDDVTSYSIPDFTASKGEPYTNIRETILKLNLRIDSIIKNLVKYRSIY